MSRVGHHSPGVEERRSIKRQHRDVSWMILYSYCYNSQLSSTDFILEKKEVKASMRKYFLNFDKYSRKDGERMVCLNILVFFPFSDHIQEEAQKQSPQH